MNIENPCVTCGACCAYYRVSFHWLECDPEGITGPLPEQTVPRDHHQVCMAGTFSKPSRCVALAGDICSSVRCLIYERRASPCRNFGIQMQKNGGWTISVEHLRHCNEARAYYDLPPLVSPAPIIPSIDDLSDISAPVHPKVA